MKYSERVRLVRQTIAVNLYNYRAKHDMTLSDMSELLGVSASAISNWENMHRTMEVELMWLVFEKTGMNLMSLILDKAS